jgi:hypothetical protein
MKVSERKLVFEKYECAYCGCNLQKGWHVDHGEPCRRITRSEWVQGLNEMGRWVEKLVGYSNPDSHHIDNYMPSCPSCKINKHGDTIEQFRKNIQGYLNSLNLRMVQYKMAKKYGLVEVTGKEVVVLWFEKCSGIAICERCSVLHKGRLIKVQQLST